MDQTKNETQFQFTFEGHCSNFGIMGRCTKVKLMHDLQGVARNAAAVAATTAAAVAVATEMTKHWHTHGHRTECIPMENLYDGTDSGSSGNIHKAMLPVDKNVVKQLRKETDHKKKMKQHSSNMESDAMSKLNDMNTFLLKEASTVAYNLDDNNDGKLADIRRLQLAQKYNQFHFLIKKLLGLSISINETVTEADGNGDEMDVQRPTVGVVTHVEQIDVSNLPSNNGSYLYQHELNKMKGWIDEQSDKKKTNPLDKHVAQRMKENADKTTFDEVVLTVRNLMPSFLFAWYMCTSLL